MTCAPAFLLSGVGEHCRQDRIDELDARDRGAEPDWAAAGKGRRKAALHFSGSPVEYDHPAGKRSIEFDGGGKFSVTGKMWRQKWQNCTRIMLWSDVETGHDKLTRPVKSHHLADKLADPAAAVFQSRDLIVRKPGLRRKVVAHD